MPDALQLAVDTNDASLALVTLRALFQESSKMTFPTTFISYVRKHPHPVSFMLNIASDKALRTFNLQLQRKLLRGLAHAVRTVHHGEELRDTVESNQEGTDKRVQEVEDGRTSEDRQRAGKRGRITSVESSKQDRKSDIPPPASAASVCPRDANRLIALLADVNNTPLLVLLVPSFDLPLAQSTHCPLGLSLFSRLFDVGALAECVLLVDTYGLHPFCDHRELLLRLAEQENKQLILKLLDKDESRVRYFCGLLKEKCRDALTTMEIRLETGESITDLVGRESELKSYARAASAVMSKHAIDCESQYHAVTAAIRLQGSF